MTSLRLIIPCILGWEGSGNCQALLLTGQGRLLPALVKTLSSQCLSRLRLGVLTRVFPPRIPGRGRLPYSAFLFHPLPGVHR